jgi:hypothetical protein
MEPLEIERRRANLRLQGCNNNVEYDNVEYDNVEYDNVEYDNVEYDNVKIGTRMKDPQLGIVRI